MAALVSFLNLNSFRPDIARKPACNVTADFCSCKYDFLAKYLRKFFCTLSAAASRRIISYTLRASIPALREDKFIETNILQT